MRRLLIFIAAFTLAAAWLKAGVSEWVDSVYNSLTPRERVAQLFIPHLVIGDNEQGHAAVRKLVGKEGVGGLLLGKGTSASYAALNGLAMSLAKVPLMNAADAEWGVAMRLSDAPRFPYNIALGAGDDLEAMEEYGREVARECRRLGIVVNFAPVADVNSNPDNPIIGYRSFGEDPERVAALAAAYARGLENGGVMAVGKHFPGHGDTSTDSHKTVPVVNRTAAQFEEMELVPFKRLIGDGIGGILVGHLRVPSLDDSGMPASLSRPVITRLLKEKMGFDGLVFTDALEMAGAQVRGENNCVLALEAGADILLGSLSPSKDIDAVMAALDSGRLSWDAVNQSVMKVLYNKYYLSRDLPRPAAGFDNVDGLQRRLARMSATVLRDDASLLPLRSGCREIIVDGRGAVPAPPAEGTVVAVVTSHKESAVAALKRLSAAAGDRLAAVFFMNPYRVTAFSAVLKNIPTVVVVGDNTAALRTETLRMLRDCKAAINGRLPVSIAGVGKAGDGISIAPQASHDAVGRLDEAVDSLIDRGLSTGAFSGCQVVVLKNGKPILDIARGQVRRSGQNPAPVTPETLFDLASVSKLSGTLLATMAAVDRGEIALTDTLGKFLPAAAGTSKGRITIRQLVSHHSGLPAAIDAVRFYENNDSLFSRTKSREFPLQVAENLYACAEAPDSVVNYIIKRVGLRGNGYKYSCLNYILLARALEAATGMPLDRQLAVRVYGPMNLDRMGYNPLTRHGKDEMVATEFDPDFRRTTVQGTVHDETAAIMGGVSGNAGLFGNAASVAAIGQMLLNRGEYGDKRIISKQTVDSFLGDRLGFATRDNGRWLGHTGFTGTCIWLDPRQDIVAVILTNRIHPSRNSQADRTLGFRNAVMRLLDKSFSSQ